MGIWALVVDGTTYEFDTLGLSVGAALGAGMPPLELATLPYATLDGAQFQRTRAGVRVLTLNVFLSGTSLSNLHTKKAALIALLRRDRSDPQVPVTLKYTGGPVTPLYLDAYYDSGLELAQRQGWGEQIPLRFLAPAPSWYGAAATAALGVQETIITSAAALVARRDEAGSWQASIIVSASLRATRDGRVLSTTSSSTAIYDWPQGDAAPTTTSLGTAGSGATKSAIDGPDGTIYLAASGVYRRDGAVWNAIGSITGAQVIAIDLLGRLITQDASYVLRRWNGSTWEALGSALSFLVRALAVGLDGTLYAGGDFTGVIRRWNGSAWEVMDAALTSECKALVVGLDGTLYAGGTFPGLVRRWNGSAWEILGGGLSPDLCNSLSVGPNGLLYASGTFSSAGGVSVPKGLAVWNGAAWFPGDFDTGGGQVFASAVTTTGQLWASASRDPFDAGDTVVSPALTTAANPGSAAVSPQIVIAAPAGGRLYLVRNERTGAAIYSDLAMLAGEEVVIDCARKTMVSSFRGPILRHIIPGSQLGRFSLLPGNNPVSVLHEAATATCELRWTNRYWSLDG